MIAKDRDPPAAHLLPAGHTRNQYLDDVHRVDQISKAIVAMDTWLQAINWKLFLVVNFYDEITFDHIKSEIERFLTELNTHLKHLYRSFPTKPTPLYAFIAIETHESGHPHAHILVGGCGNWKQEYMEKLSKVWQMRFWPEGKWPRGRLWMSRFAPHKGGTRYVMKELNEQHNWEFFGVPAAVRKRKRRRKKKP